MISTPSVRKVEKRLKVKKRDFYSGEVAEKLNSVCIKVTRFYANYIVTGHGKLVHFLFLNSCLQYSLINRLNKPQLPIFYLPFLVHQQSTSYVVIAMHLFIKLSWDLQYAWFAITLAYAYSDSSLHSVFLTRAHFLSTQSSCIAANPKLFIFKLSPARLGSFLFLGN